MSHKHFVKLQLGNKVFGPTRVSTEGCEYVDDFEKEIKKEFSPDLDSYPTHRLTLYEADGTTVIDPETDIEELFTKEKPFVAKVEENQLPLEFVSMAYGKADMPFIVETTGIQEEEQVWENIPVDDGIKPSEEFVELFKKNCSVFEFNLEASRRTVIDLFLREVVSQFSEFVVICEYRMTLVNDTKRRRLNGQCDYTICHRGLRKLPHLVAIEAKTTNKETLLQCIGEMASIYYRRKTAKMKNACVYGFHSTGSIWKFAFIDQEGVLYISKEYPLNVEHYVKEGFEAIYRLVYYLVKQSQINSPRTTPHSSFVNVPQ